MDYDIDVYIDEIDKSKENMAMAIAKCYYDEIGGNVNEYFHKFYNMIKDVEIYFFNAADYTSKYEKEVNNLIDEINKTIGYNIKPYFFEGKRNVKRFCDSIFDTILLCNNAEEFFKVNELYKKNMRKYYLIGLDIKNFYYIYKVKGVDNLDKLIKKLNLKTNFYKLKKDLSLFWDDFYSRKYIVEEFEELISRYDIKNLKDLLLLKEEIKTFFINENKLSSIEKDDMYRKRYNLYKRLGKEYYYSPAQAKEIIRKIDKICSDNLFNEIFVSSRMNDFFKKNDVLYTEMNIREIVDIYLDLVNSIGVSFDAKFGLFFNHYCFFQEEIINYSNNDRNQIILHEFVHSCEQNYNNIRTFKVKCKEMNEAITEYLSCKAVCYLKEDVIKTEGRDKKWYSGSLYDCMFPLVQELKNSNVWKYVVKAKMNNDLDYLVDKIGEDNLNKINLCFSKTYKKWNDTVEGDKNLSELKTILKNINVRNPRKL